MLCSHFAMHTYINVETSGHFGRLTDMKKFLVLIEGVLKQMSVKVV